MRFSKRVCGLLMLASLAATEFSGETLAFSTPAPTKPSVVRCTRHINWEKTTVLCMSNVADDLPRNEEDDDDDDDDEVEPGKMRVSEIKAELNMRGIDFSDCFDKESLAAKLADARATGKADPEILNVFNKQKLEENFKGEKVEVKDEDIEKAVASDGTLPGGMSPETLQKLMSNPEVMTLLQSTKMQEAMKLMMTGGREDLEKAMAEDKEMVEVVSKLDSVLRSLQ